MTTNDKVHAAFFRITSARFANRDTSEIIRLCKERGVELTHTSAAVLWDAFSDSWAAGWLVVDASMVDSMISWAENISDEP